jgi:hypothetical protein
MKTHIHYHQTLLVAVEQTIDTADHECIVGLCTQSSGVRQTSCTVEAKSVEAE